MKEKYIHVHHPVVHKMYGSLTIKIKDCGDGTFESKFTRCSVKDNFSRKVGREIVDSRLCTYTGVLHKSLYYLENIHLMLCDEMLNPCLPKEYKHELDKVALIIQTYLSFKKNEGF